MSVQVETAVIGGIALVLGAVAGAAISLVGSFISASRERARETVRWQREETSRREVADREREDRRAEWLRDREDRRAAWLRDHQRQAIVNYLTASDECRAAYITSRMRPSREATAALPGLILRDNNALSEMWLLFEAGMGPPSPTTKPPYGHYRGASMARSLNGPRL